MLVLTRNIGQRIILGEGANRIVVTLVSVQRNQARIGLDAPKDVKIVREEIEYRYGGGTEK